MYCVYLSNSYYNQFISETLISLFFILVLVLQDQVVNRVPHELLVLPLLPQNIKIFADVPIQIYCRVHKLLDFARFQSKNLGRFPISFMKHLFSHVLSDTFFYLFNNHHPHTFNDFSIPFTLLFQLFQFILIFFLHVLQSFFFFLWILSVL